MRGFALTIMLMHGGLYTIDHTININSTIHSMHKQIRIVYSVFNPTLTI